MKKLNNKGFSLVEVMVALAILVVFMVPLLGALNQSMKAASRSRELREVYQLAVNRLEQLELEDFPEVGEELEGDFSPHRPDIKYRIIYEKSPELELLEEQVAGLEVMDVIVELFWSDGNEVRSIELYTIISR